MSRSTGPVVLGIETSCDDTAAAVWDGDKIRANLSASQAVHADYGGVVPELASRDHERHLVPLVQATLKKAGVELDQLDAVAFTRGPGLLGSLLVGASFAKALSWGRSIPLLGVNHMKAHVLAHFIEPPFPTFPFLCLTVSGGHTQIVRVNDPLDLVVLGNTRDDAAGEAFDKCGKLLGLPYPAGPLIDQLAAGGNGKRFSFPPSNMPDLDFSFSGIKTAVRYFVRDQEAADPGFVSRNLADLAASVQDAIVQSLITKLEKAAEQTGIRELALAGGVSANRGLRSGLEQLCIRKGYTCHVLEMAYCTDNAAMIARAAAFRLAQGKADDLDVSVEARLNWSEG